MTQAQALVETVSINYEDFNDSFLTCSTCLSMYDGAEHPPKLLPCSHTVSLRSYCDQGASSHAMSQTDTPVAWVLRQGLLIFCDTRPKIPVQTLSWELRLNYLTIYHATWYWLWLSPRHTGLLKVFNMYNLPFYSPGFVDKVLWFKGFGYCWSAAECLHFGYRSRELFYDELRHTKSLKTGPHCPRQPIRHPNVIGQCEPAINLVLDCVLVSSLFESNYWLRLFRWS